MTRVYLILAAQHFRSFSVSRSAKFLPKICACCEVQMKLAGVLRSLLTPNVLLSSSFWEGGGVAGSLQPLSTTAQFCACSLPRWRGVCTQNAWRLCLSHRRRWWLSCSVKASLGKAAASRKGTRWPWLSCAAVSWTTSSSKGCVSLIWPRGLQRTTADAWSENLFLLECHRRNSTLVLRVSLVSAADSSLQEHASTPRSLEK